MNKEISSIDHELLTNWFRINLLQLDRYITDIETDFISATAPFIKRKKNGLPTISEHVKVNGEQRNFIPDGVCSVYSNKQNFRLLFLCDSVTRKETITRNVGHYSTLDYVWITDRESMFRHDLTGRIWIRGGNKKIPLQSILGMTDTLDLPPVEEV